MWHESPLRTYTAVARASTYMKYEKKKEKERREERRSESHVP